MTYSGTRLIFEVFVSNLITSNYRRSLSTVKASTEELSSNQKIVLSLRFVIITFISKEVTDTINS